MDIRDRILDAAKRVYAQHGFRGATTRLIAIEAGVNEVTLFRTFGSKAALFAAFMQEHVSRSPIPELPDTPVNPEREMTKWVTIVLGHMRDDRSLIRKSFGEIEDRPEAATSMCEGPELRACDSHRIRAPSAAERHRGRRRRRRDGDRDAREHDDRRGDCPRHHGERLSTA